MDRRLRRTVPALLAVSLAAVSLTGCGLLPLPLPLPPPEPPPETAPPSLAQPIRLIPVAEVTQGDCPSDAAADAFEDDEGSCFTVLADEGMTVNELEAIHPPEQQGGWSVDIVLKDEDAAALEQLTTQLAGRDAPQNRVAIVMDTDLVSAPTVSGPIPGGQIAVGFGEKDEAEDFYEDLIGQDD